jgi:hypothetical protein
MGMLSLLKRWEKVSQKVGGIAKSRSRKVSDNELSDFPKKLRERKEVR